MEKKKIINIIGARPQIIKSSSISRANRTKFQNEIKELIVHTGQHYDENMSEVFFEELQIPKPHFNLNVGSGSHGAQTAKMIEGLESIFLAEKPDAVVVYGDTNSTIAGGLAAAKIHIPIVHIEAGLRSFNKAMPEELNRIACDHFSTLLFTPTAIGLENLRKEGFSTTINSKATIDQPNVYQCGDIMFDNSMYFSEISDEKSTILKINDLAKDNYVLCTIHRDSNTDIAANLNSIFRALIQISESKSLKIVLPIHPRTKGKMEELLDSDLLLKLKNSTAILIIPPAGFLDIIALEKNARIIISDSGGLQKESFFFQKPCVILREQTEWIEIVENGNALLAGSDFDKIIDSFNLLYNKTNYSFPAFYGDGDAASFICQKIVEDL
jgi:UDP-GlcNAc3NAcA epimerase